MVAGIVRFLCIAAVAVLAAACVEGTATGPALETSAMQDFSPALAFEPVAGIPEERTAVLAEALVSGVVERGVAVVPRGSDEATHRVRGEFTAVRTGSSTEIAYAWDVFDRRDVRVHRIAGAESVQAGLPDPWQAVTDDALRRIAERSVEELHDWLERGAPVSPELSQAAPAIDGGVDGITALLATPAVAAPSPAAAAPSVHVGPVAGVAPEGAAALTQAMAARLVAAGAAWAALPGQADYIVTGEATVGPAHNGQQAVAIIWSVSQPGGASLGTVRQVRHVAAGALDRSWGRSAESAAGAAVPGVLSLMQSQ